MIYSVELCCHWESQLTGAAWFVIALSAGCTGPARSDLGHMILSVGDDLDMVEISL